MAHWTEQLYEDQAATFADFFENRYEQAADEVQALLELIAAERGVEPERVLDVACGTGRHVLAFAADGCDAEGLDFSEPFVDRAREQAADRGLDDRTAFHVDDMRHLDEWDGSYDLISTFWNSLGHYDKQTDVEILSAMNRLRSEDGTVVVEMTNKEHYLKNYESASVREVGNRLHVSRKQFDLTTGRFHTTIDVFSTGNSGYDHLQTMEFKPRIYAPVELKEMCERAGFDEIDLFGGFDGSDLSLDSSSVVLIAG